MTAPITSLLASDTSGEVLTFGNPGYDAARTVWNGRFESRPAVIVRCADAGDVQAALRHAREAGMSITVRAMATATRGCPRPTAGS